MADRSDGGGFTFPSLPKPKPLPVQNPLLAGAKVTDRTAAGGGGAQPPAPQRVPLAPPPARRKVPFEKGFSQMDWVRLTQTHPDLVGLGAGGRPRRGITLAEVALHASEDDCWTVLRGKVYNITHYLKFHPGGVPLLLKVAGRDGTALFNKYHAWVNYDFLLAKCLVGTLAPPGAPSAAPPAAAEDGGGAAGDAAANEAAEGAAADGAAAAGAAEEAAARAAGEGAAEGAASGGGGGGSNSSSATDLQQLPQPPNRL